MNDNRTIQIGVHEVIFWSHK